MNGIPTDREIFRLPIRVLAEDIDELNHVNNTVYLRWVQDISYAHWNTASEEMRSQCKWVVLRHEIDYHSPALSGDELLGLTWIEAPEGARQIRRVSIQRLSDSKVLASASTTWCLLDPITNRPKRVTREISSALGLKD